MRQVPPLPAILGAFLLACGTASTRLRLVAPAPTPAADGAPWALCTPPADLDLDAENAAGLATVREFASRHVTPYDLIVIPGYTPLDATEPTPIVHPTAAARLDDAIAAYQHGLAPILLVTGGNVHPDGTPFNEAMLMKRYLVSKKVPAGAIILEPCARHSHTNLRNAGRFMQSYGLVTALVVTSTDQAFYFANPKMSGFDERCVVDLGYLVGTFQTQPEGRVAFRPGDQVRTRGADPRDP
ncbi:MAG TPA: YdcF family protein [Polyangiaceae bacterium]